MTRSHHLLEYHAIIVDDLESAFFNPDQSTLVQKFVSERGGGFLMLGGMESFEEGKYQRTPIGDMLPVYLDNPVDQPAPTSGWFMNLSREGWLEPWVRLRKNQDDDRDRLQAVRPYQVLNKVHGIKPGATVLASLTAPGQTEAPAMITQRFGKGMTGAILVGELPAIYMPGTELVERLEALASLEQPTRARDLNQRFASLWLASTPEPELRRLGV